MECHYSLKAGDIVYLLKLAKSRLLASPFGESSYWFEHLLLPGGSKKYINRRKASVISSEKRYTIFSGEHYFLIARCFADQAEIITTWQASFIYLLYPQEIAVPDFNENRFTGRFQKSSREILCREKPNEF